MKPAIHHIAIWTSDLEKMKDYYSSFFQGKPNEKYINHERRFESYFLTFDSGTCLELMQMPGVPENLNDTEIKQHQGIIHIAFGVENMQIVNEKAEELKKAGYRILRGPRKTGDGYWEFETLDPENNRIEVTTKYVQ
jgi:lactoylglutathione lyase